MMPTIDSQILLGRRVFMTASSSRIWIVSLVYTRFAVPAEAAPHGHQCQRPPEVVRRGAEGLWLLNAQKIARATGTG